MEHSLVVVIEPLSSREVEVLQLVADGQTGPEIAVSLFISYKTVRSHINTILSKLGAHNRIEAVIEGKRLGILKSTERLFLVQQAILALTQLEPAALRNLIDSDLIKVD